MNLVEIEKIVNNLIDTFIFSGNVSLDLRNKGLEKKIKSDNTPVTNGEIIFSVNLKITNHVYYNLFFVGVSCLCFNLWDFLYRQTTISCHC